MIMKRYLDKLTILQKILVSSIIFALPILVLLFYMVSGFNRDIRFTRLEIAGTTLLTPLEELARLVSEHQLLVRLYIEGDKTLEGQINGLAGEIEKQLGTVRKEVKRLERPLQITEKNLKDAGIENGYVTDVARNWENLRNNWKNNGTFQSDDAHEMILKPVRRLIKRVADTSNLVLDPALDTTYLIDVGIITCAGIEKLGNFTLFMESVIYKGMRSRDDTERFAMFAGILENDLGNVRRSVETALVENRRLYGPNTSLQRNVPSLVAQYESSLIPFIVILKRLANDPDFKMSVPELLQSSKELTMAASGLRDASMAELQLLLKKRVDDQTRKRLVALILRA